MRLFLLRVVALAVLTACGSQVASNDGSSAASPDSGPPGSSPSPDGGSSQPYAPKGITLGDSSVVAMSFANAKNGFMLVGDGQSLGVWATTDGGDSWAKRDLEGIPTSVGLTADLGRVWVGAQNAASGMWTSDDHGASFSPLTFAETDTPGQIAFVDASTVLVAGVTGDRVHRTVDGGTTWATHEFGSDVFTGGHQLAVRGRDVWVAGGFDSAADGAHVAHSTDAGETWSTAALTDDANSHEGGSLHAIALGASAADVWVAGANRQIFHTTDAGGMWTQVKQVPASLGNFGGAVVDGARVTMAATSDDGYSLFESVDRGATFQITGSLRCPFTCGSVAGLASPRPGLYFVYGFSGLLWRIERPVTP